MKTLYIDVYFLINLTVDILALYFSSLFFRLPIRVWRLVLAGCAGAAFATASVLCSGHRAAVVLFTALGFLSMILLCASGTRFFRLFRFALGFLLLEILIGGLVYFFYGILADVIQKVNIATGGGAENRNLFILSVIVLLSVGVLRLVCLSFSGTGSEQMCEVSFEFLSHIVRVEALVDSGNLLRDPLDGTPVMLWKASDASHRLCVSQTALRMPSKKKMKSRVRLIPVRNGANARILTGYRVESVTVRAGKKNEKVNLIIAIDEEDGTYGGYHALVPSAVLDIC